MDFDALVASVVPAAFVEDVKDILVAAGFTFVLASQAWDLGCRRGRRVVVCWFESFGRFGCST